MNKVEAVITIIDECRRHKMSNASAQRQVKACKTLGLERDDLIQVLSFLGVCKEDGEPYWNIKRTW